MAMRAVGTAGMPASESVVAAASRILAAMIAGGRLNESNRPSLVRLAVSLALDVAQEAELAAVRPPGPRPAPPAAPSVASAPAATPDAEVAADDILDLLD